MHLVLNGRIAELEGILREREAVIHDNTTKISYSSTQKETLKERNKEIKLLKMEVC